MMGRIVFAAALCLLALVAVQGFQNGAPRCRTDAADIGSFYSQNQQMTGNSQLRRDGNAGWYVQVSNPNFGPNENVTVNVVNTNSATRFKGLLLWAHDSRGEQSTIGTFSGYSNSNFKVPLSQAACGTSSVTHTNANSKAQSAATFIYRAPSTATGSISFRAFVVEDCNGQAAGSCSGVHYFTDALVVGNMSGAAQLSQSFFTLLLLAAIAIFML